MLNYRTLMLIPMLITLTGCQFYNTMSSPFYQRESTIIAPGSEHVYTTSGKIDTRQYKPMLYVKMNNFSHIYTGEYKSYVMKALNDANFFEKVITKQPTILINTDINDIHRRGKKGEDYWYSSYDPLTLEQIRAVYGEPQQKFLVAEATLRQHVDGDRWTMDKLVFDLKVIEPETGQTLFHAIEDSVGWLGVGWSVLDPPLDAAINWLREHDVTHSMSSAMMEKTS